MRAGTLSREAHHYQRILGELLQRSRNPLHHYSKAAGSFANSRSFVYGDAARFGMFSDGTRRKNGNG